MADVAKGIETVGFVCSLPQWQVTRGVMCQDERVPLDFEACIVQIALVMGNCVMLKPSEKVPLTMYRVAELMVEALFRKGVFNMVNVSVEAVNALITKRLVRCFVLSRTFCQVDASR